MNSQYIATKFNITAFLTTQLAIESSNVSSLSSLISQFGFKTTNEINNKEVTLEEQLNDSLTRLNVVIKMLSEQCNFTHVKNLNLSQNHKNQVLRNLSLAEQQYQSNLENELKSLETKLKAEQDLKDPKVISDVITIKSTAKNKSVKNNIKEK